MESSSSLSESSSSSSSCDESNNNNNNDDDKLLFESNCIKAAHALAESDILVVVTGAGWGADSGLATYDDIAKVPAYHALNLTYSDICQSHWLHSKPELFYGFWGQCYKDYRTTQPHKGYDIIQRWRDDKNKFDPLKDKNVANDIRSAMIDKVVVSRPFDSPEIQKMTPYIAQGLPGAFFCFTSNVDGHFYDYLDSNEIYDCHGCIELWQCSDPDCNSGIWRVPLSWDFQIDKTTMLAPSTKTNKPLASEEDNENEENNDHHVVEDGCSSFRKINKEQFNNNGYSKTSCIGHTIGREVRNKQRMLQYMPEGTDKIGWYVEEECNKNNDDDDDENDGIETSSSSNNISNNWPKCGHCYELARPAILMFGDWTWKCDESQSLRWDLWLETIQDEFANNNNYKVCVIEIGCGTNVQTCRRTSESIVSDIIQNNGNAKLIRVNPDYPSTDDVMVNDVLIPIKSRGLKAIQRIDEIYKEIIQKHH